MLMKRYIESRRICIRSIFYDKFQTFEVCIVKIQPLNGKIGDIVRKTSKVFLFLGWIQKF